VIALSRTFDAAERREIRMRAIFDAGKLDPRTYDEDTVAPFAVRLAPSAWRELAALAERAWAELGAVERALLDERRAWRSLGIPWKVRSIVASSPRPSARDARFARFDFHPTTEGWRVSEINADVPGGFLEAGALTRIVAERLPGMTPLADPARALAEAIARRIPGGSAALVHATSYTDDQQVVRRIGAELAALGVRTHLASPAHVVPSGSRARLSTTGAEVDALMRFFPCEWLGNLARADRAHWRALPDGLVRSNPPAALLIQGKRLPITMRALGIDAPTWRALVPEVSPIGVRRFAPKLVPPGHVLKPVWGRIGEGIVIEGATAELQARRARLMARIFPRNWCLQRRFESSPLRVAGDGVSYDGVSRDGAAHDGVSIGPFHVCVGVYVIDGRAAGAYARVAPRALIDGRAQDAAVLLDPALDLALDPATDPSIKVDIGIPARRTTARESAREHASLQAMLRSSSNAALNAALNAATHAAPNAATHAATSPGPHASHEVTHHVAS
jgi:hypothetical protein